jgi:hypothetical protein
MKARNTVLTVVAAIAGLWLMAAPVSANRVIGVTVTGQITAVHGDSAIVVQGTTYRIKPGSPAYNVLKTLTPGQLVDLLLDGPPGNSATSVVAIATHQGH